MKQRLSAALRARALFALVFQGINGMIQVVAFVALQGSAYLAFSAAYLLGTVLSLACALNLENSVLGGAFTRSVRHYFAAFWTLGVAAALLAVVSGQGVPSFIAFLGFGVCLRLFLAWANQARPAPLALASAGALVLAAGLRGRLGEVMLAAMLAFPLAAWGATRPATRADAGMLTVLRESATAFAKYLPHTLCGLAIGYLDRYLALAVVGGAEAEVYLRTVQVCSWAAFVIYPVVFQARSRVLQAGRLRPHMGWQIAAAIALAMVVATAAILCALQWAGRMPALVPAVVALTGLSLVCSQTYQVVSTLNFVDRRFAMVNRITLGSALVALATAALWVPAWPSALALAAVLLSGWATQLGLTVRGLRQVRAAPGAGP